MCADVAAAFPTASSGPSSKVQTVATSVVIDARKTEDVEPRGEAGRSYVDQPFDRRRSDQLSRRGGEGRGSHKPSQALF